MTRATTLRSTLAIGALLALALARPADAQPAPDPSWHGDVPGQIHRIDPDALPAPGATPSVARGPSVVARPPNAKPSVPPGFSVDLFADHLDMPRVLRVAPNGDVFLAESGAGRVLVFRVPDGAERPAQRAVFASGLDQPFGIAFWPPGPSPRFVYVAETNRVVRYPYTPGAVKAEGEPQVIVPRLPTGGHWTRDLAFSPDGSRLFVSVGSASNDGSALGSTPPAGWDAAHGLGAAWSFEQGRADVLSFDPDGGHAGTFATGLRNCVGEAVQPGTGALWCVVNERDGLGDDLPPDYATAVAQGGFYGWPWFYIGENPDPSFEPVRSDLKGHVTRPDVLIQAHSAPLGIAFYTGESFPPEYRGDAFVALHGSWNRARRTGYKVVRLRFEDGRPTGAYEDFLTGFVASDRAVWGRPVGVAVLHDGALLVSEDGNGTLWRVAYTGPHAP